MSVIAEQVERIKLAHDDDGGLEGSDVVVSWDDGDVLQQQQRHFAFDSACAMTTSIDWAGGCVRSEW